MFKRILILTITVIALFAFSGTAMAGLDKDKGTITLPEHVAEGVIKLVGNPMDVPGLK